MAGSSCIRPRLTIIHNGRELTQPLRVINRGDDMVDDTIDDTANDTADDSVNDRVDDRVNAPNACRLRPIVLSVKPTDERAIGDTRQPDSNILWSALRGAIPLAGTRP